MPFKGHKKPPGPPAKRGFEAIPPRAFLDEEQLRHHLEKMHPQFKGHFHKEAIELRGKLVFPQQHIEMHQVLENQLQLKRMSFVGEALRDLQAAGADEHEARHVLAHATHELMRTVMLDDADYDEAAHRLLVRRAVANFVRR